MLLVFPGFSLPLLAVGKCFRFEMLEQIAKLYPDRSQMGTTVNYPNGSTSYGSGDSGKSNELVGILLAKDPVRLMELDTPAWAQNAAGQWAKKDVEGFAGWLTEQPKEVVGRNAPYVVNQLNRLERFDEAIEWAMAMEGQRQGYVGSTLNGWSRKRPEEARTWLENADLSEEDRRAYQDYIRQSQ